ncbi:hypothetical protein CDD82_4427 [Ophiocordyceps australis]|uniref:Myb-like domain-containing protein n=1 Tax=Ophiocordyceps australis TaxID=1399860 RepID=A0A2C5ZSR7_9HYPO|nr:hypothetical protein CDD82_4427 [Ophiocordyceps australis]
MESDDSYYPGLESEAGALSPSHDGLGSHDECPHDEPGGSSRKNKRNKRPMPDCDYSRPLKRQKGCFNVAYLELLNREIEDAAERICIKDVFDAPQTQLGLVIWSPIEKQQLFEALGRLGRHDLAGIAAFIQSKSQVQVSQYIHHLQTACSQKQALSRRSIVELAEIPAAVQVGPQCCHVQEEAADCISLKQEHREVHQEEEKWGSLWNLTPEIAREWERDQGDDDSNATRPPFTSLLNLAKWLKLAQRFYMNSSVPTGNWTYFDESPPSIWATAFDDFYSLALSLTRRLVQTTLYVSMSRLRAQSALDPRPENIVRKGDALAAIATLSMPCDSHKHWIGLARRLRLNVYEELPGPMQECDMKPMSYNQVESALHIERNGQDLALQQIHVNSQRQESFQQSPQEDDNDDDDDDDYENYSNEPKNHQEYYNNDEKMDGRNHDHGPLDKHDARLDSVRFDDIAHEVDEVLRFSAAGLRDISSARNAIGHRIMAERWQEEQAERHDAFASYQAEQNMWRILDKKPPVGLAKIQDPGKIERCTFNMDSVWPLKGDWSSQLDYQGEWETLDRDINQTSVLN